MREETLQGLDKQNWIKAYRKKNVRKFPGLSIRTESHLENKEMPSFCFS